MIRVSSGNNKGLCLFLSARGGGGVKCDLNFDILFAAVKFSFRGLNT